MRLGRYRQRNNRLTFKPKTTNMNWKQENKDYIDSSVSTVTGIVIFIICLLIGCLAGNL